MAISKPKNSFGQSLLGCLVQLTGLIGISGSLVEHENVIV